MSSVGSEMVKAITFVISILIGPAFVHYIINHRGEPMLICSSSAECRPKMILYFVAGFVLTWSVYWLVRLAVYLIRASESSGDND